MKYYLKLGNIIGYIDDNLKQTNMYNSLGKFQKSNKKNQLLINKAESSH